MAKLELHRRTLLKGLLGGSIVTIGLPMLQYFYDPTLGAKAQGVDGFPRRFGLFFWGNGILPDRWNPSGEGMEWSLSDQLAPLSELKSSITVVSGTRLAVPNTAPHLAGAAGILSGAELIDPYGENQFSSATVDQLIAQHTAEFTRFRSLEFGAEPGRGLSYVSAGLRNPPESSPLAFFQRVFGGDFQLPGSEGIVDPTLALKRSVLDTVMDSLSEVRGRVGQEDRIRLEAHFDGVRALERRLARLEEAPPALDACRVPEAPLPDYPAIEGRPQLAEKNRVMADIAALAMACDQTRVFSNFLTAPVSNPLFPGAPAGHHQLTHDEPGDQPEVHKIVVQCIEAFAEQIRALQAIPEGDGTLLDNMVVLGTSDCSQARIHSLDDFPVLLAGACGGRLRTGLHYRSVGAENTGKVILSVMRAVGVEAPSFGVNGAAVSEGLGAIEI